MAALEAIYPTPPGRLAPQSREEAEAFLADALYSFPLLTVIGIRASIWFVGLSPIFIKGKHAPIHRLSPEHRVEAVNEMFKSDHYLVRQMPGILKTVGSFFYAKTTRIQTTQKHPELPNRQSATPLASGSQIQSDVPLVLPNLAPAMNGPVLPALPGLNIPGEI